MFGETIIFYNKDLESSNWQPTIYKRLFGVPGKGPILQASKKKIDRKLHASFTCTKCPELRSVAAMDLQKSKVFTPGSNETHFFSTKKMAFLALVCK